MIRLIEITSKHIEDGVGGSCIQCPIALALQEEYKTIDFTGKEYCTEKGIEIYYNSREHRFSSTEIKTRLKK